MIILLCVISVSGEVGLKLVINIKLRWKKFHLGKKSIKQGKNEKN